MAEGARIKVKLKYKHDDEKDDEGNTKLKPGPGRASRQLASFWLDQIGQYDESRSAFIKRGNDVIKRYRDERNRIDAEGQRRMNVLWANTRIMLPAIYSKPPIPIIDRRFLDRDPIGRLSSQIGERACRSEIANNGFHKAVKAAVLDYLLPGQGTVWVRYESKIGESVSAPTAMSTSMEDDLERIEEDNDIDIRRNAKTKQLESTGEQVEVESVIVDYVDWKDIYFLPAKARTWAEVQCVGKKVLMSKAEAKERFGEEIGEAMRADTTPQGGSADRPDNRDTSIFQDINERSLVVYELWNKSDRRAYWCSSGYEYLCDVRDDPFDLEGFFPTPEPLFANPTNDSLVPVADYIQYQDQAIQIDELTHRIAMLTKACKIAGTYDASNNALRRLFDESVENELIPVDQWAMYADKGGVPGAISLVPLKEIQACLQTLQQVRREVQQDLDTVTGINDVLRGTTDSRETLGGIRLKSNATGTRLSDRQADVARFARDIVRIIVELMCKKFSAKTLIDASGVMYEDELDKKTLVDQFKAGMQQKPGAQPGPQQGAQPPAPQIGGGQPPQPQLPPPAQGGAPQGMPPQMQPPGNNVVPLRPGLPPPQPQGLQRLLPNPKQIDEMHTKIFSDMAEELIQSKLDAAIELLREDIPRRYRIDIEVDSTIYADASQERADAVEFLTAAMKFLTGANEIINEAPDAAPLMGKMLQFAVRKFRSGRDLEAAIDDFVDKMSKKAVEAAKNPKPDPETNKMMIENRKAQAAENQLQLEGQMQKANDDRTAQNEQLKTKMELEKQQYEFQRQKELDALEFKYKEMELQLKFREAEMKHQYAQADHQRNTETAVLTHTLDKDMANTAHAHEKEKMAQQATMPKKESGNAA